MRIALNAHVTGGAVGVAEAIGLLRYQLSHPAHVYWGEGIEIIGAATKVPWERVMGYRQVTDAYLLGLCVARGGKLATFDRGILALAGTGEERDAVEVIQ
jgi:predicted nucleic acid-binding protein